MRTSPRRALAALSLLGALAILALSARADDAAAPAPGGVDVPLTLVNGSPYVDLVVDGHAGTFLFDTGANTSGLDRGWLAATGIWYWPGAPATVGGTTGALPAGTAILDALALGDGAFARPVFAIEDFGGFAQPPGRPQAGLLGMDLIACYQVALDLEAGTLRIATEAERAAPPAGATAVPLSLPLDLPTVPARVGGIEVACRLDTGAAYEDARPFLDVNPAAVAAIAAAGHALVKTGEVTMVGVAGPETRDLLEGATAPLALRIGPVRVRGVVLVVDRSGTLGAETTPLALAGAPIIRRLGPVVLDPFAKALYVGGGK